MSTTARISPSEPARTGDPVRATVWADGVETAYLRAGCGPTLLLLLSQDQLHVSGAPLLSGLSERFRVLMPSTRERDVTTTWIAGFLDGVGVTRASVVTMQAFAGLVAQVAVDDPDRVDRVIVLDGHWTESDVLEQLIASA
jgi:hypothetical protein